MISVFLCYASADKEDAEKIQVALTKSFEVFYDDQSISPGEDHHKRIQDSIQNCDLFVFLASKNSLRPGAYARTELESARKKWPNPVGRVLPVLLDSEKLPPYLEEASPLKTEGNKAVAVLFACEELGRRLLARRERERVRRKRERVRRTAKIVGSLMLVLLLAVVGWGGRHIAFDGSTEAGVGPLTELAENSTFLVRITGDQIVGKSLRFEPSVPITSLKVESERKAYVFLFLLFGEDEVVRMKAYNENGYVERELIAGPGLPLDLPEEGLSILPEKANLTHLVAFCVNHPLFEDARRYATVFKSAKLEEVVDRLAKGGEFQQSWGVDYLSLEIESENPNGHD